MGNAGASLLAQALSHCRQLRRLYLDALIDSAHGERDRGEGRREGRRERRVCSGDRERGSGIGKGGSKKVGERGCDHGTEKRLGIRRDGVKCC